MRCYRLTTPNNTNMSSNDSMKINETAKKTRTKTRPEHRNMESNEVDMATYVLEGQQQKQEDKLKLQNERTKTNPKN